MSPERAGKFFQEVVLLKSVSLAAGAIVSIALLIFFYREVTPEYRGGVWAVEGEPEQPLTLPWYVFRSDVNAHLNFTINLRNHFASRFRLRVDDCLINLRVNGTVYPLAQEACSYPRELELDLGSYLHAGENSFELAIFNGLGAGHLYFRPAPNDGQMRLFQLFTAALTIFWIVIASSVAARRLMTGTRALKNAFWGILLLGVLLRLGYFWETPAFIRSYDIEGHLGYLTYVAEHWAVPPANQGWQTYQPPLYYFMSIGWCRLLGLLGLEHHLVVDLVQIEGLLLSVVFLFVGLCLFRLFFEQNWPSFSAAGLLIAVWPGLIAGSSRVSNDSLVQPLMLMALSVSIRWWRSPNRPLLLVAAFGLASAAILAKTNALALVPAFFCLLLFHPQLSWKKKAVSCAAGAMILVLLTGWFAARRLSEPGRVHMVGNIGTVSPGLFIEDSPSSFLVFNPVKVLELTWANNWDDRTRRRYLWEYFYRSAFFGEFSFPDEMRWSATLLLFFGFELGALSLWRFGRALSSRGSAGFAPAVVLLWALASLVGIRVSANIGGMADFRYLQYSAVLLALFFGEALACLRTPFRAVAWHAVGVFVVAAVALNLYIIAGTPYLPTPI